MALAASDILRFSRMLYANRRGFVTHHIFYRLKHNTENLKSDCGGLSHLSPYRVYTFASVPREQGIISVV